MAHGIVYNIRSFSVHDGPGIRTTVFLKGCPLKCWWCHNPEGQGFDVSTWSCTRRTGNYSTSHQEPLGKEMTPKEVMDVVIKDRPFLEESEGGITLSGGEPLSQPNFCIEILKETRVLGIHSAVDTSGYVKSNDLLSVIPYADLFLFDLKIINPDDHLKYTGVSNSIIHDNFRKIYDSGKSIFVRIPLVEGITDTDINIKELIGFLDNYPTIERIDLLPYHAIAVSKYQRLGRSYPMDSKKNYPESKANEVKKRFEKLGKPISIGG